MTKPFHLIVADPPWKFSQAYRKSRGAAAHYRTLSLDELVAYPVPPMADDSLLLLWRVAAMTSEAIIVARAWGFTPKAEITWVKTTRHVEGQIRKGRYRYRDHDLHMGMGRYTRGAHEIAMVCARGRAHRLVQDHGIQSVFFAPVGPHSAKPDEFYKLSERLYPGPYVELFARRRRAGWTQYGDQLPGGRPHP